MLDRTAWDHGVTLFDEGDFWHAHEAFEGPWLRAEGLEKHFLAGVILLAASLHKARALSNARGGRRNYAKALSHLALVPDRYYGVDVRRLEATVLAALQDASLEPTVPRATEELA